LFWGQEDISLPLLFHNERGFNTCHSRLAGIQFILELMDPPVKPEDDEQWFNKETLII
jgi:hypothetical protein